VHESRAAHGVQESVVAIARKWRIIVPFVVATPLVVFALTARTQATYEATADVLLDRKGQAISGLYEFDWDYIDLPREVRTQAKLARLPEVKDRVVAEADRRGLDSDGFRSGSTVTDDGVTDVMTFHVRHEDPDAAIALATLYAHQYVARRRELDTRALRKGIAILDAQLASLRAQGADPGTYAHLVQQEQQLQTGLITIASNAKVVREAVEAPRVAPALWSETLDALLLGLLVGIGAAGFAALIDSRARSADEISAQLSLPILGRLPLEPTEERDAAALALLRRQDTQGAQAIRMLRANLGLEGVVREKSVVMVTSSVAGEGKSTTAAQLAVALALGGRDVVLVDLDLRRPALWRIFDLEKAPGVAELSRGTSDPAEAVHSITLDPVAVDGDEPVRRDASTGTLGVVPAGDLLAAEPEAIIASPGLRRAIDALRERADVILIDSPPLLQTGDALAMSSFVDALVLVAQTKRYRRRYAQELRRLLTLSPARPLGVVVIGERHELERALPRTESMRREPDLQALLRA